MYSPSMFMKELLVCGQSGEAAFYYYLGPAAYTAVCCILLRAGRQPTFGILRTGSESCRQIKLERSESQLVEDRRQLAEAGVFLGTDCNLVPLPQGG